jgi:DNA gyrase subunit A
MIDKIVWKWFANNYYLKIVFQFFSSSLMSNLFDATNLINQSIEKEITQSYIDYAMSVIVSRALPDTRDGSKPVIRRILYAMYDMKLTHTAKYKKSAAVVGDVLGKYHPHGDSSVYDAMVRLAQPFSLRYPLIDGQGNFGSIDWDGAAAMRYTEARLTKIAEQMLEDIYQDTVSWRDNYDSSRKEPMVLPTKFPNHLCNGTLGIAVGMATNMPPHNLTEIIDASLLLIENPEADIDQIMSIVKWPDFPTGGLIFDPDNIRQVYEKGKGSIVVRWKVHIEWEKKEGDVIVIDQIPYQVNKSLLVSRIGQLVNEKKIEGIYDLRDESNKNNIRVTIHLKKWVNSDTVLTLLYKFTDLQTTFSVNNVTLVEQGLQPKLLNIKDLLVQFVTFRREVITRRSQFQLQKAQDRLHILEWLKKAIDILDEVIDTIRKSQTKQEAKGKLMEDIFGFSDVQAEYILQMKLQSLVWLEIQKIVEEIGEKQKIIDYLTTILGDPKELDQVVIQEMNMIKKDYGDTRRTEISHDLSVYNLSNSFKDIQKQADLLEEDMIFRVGNDYSIRNLYQSRILNIPEDTYDLIHTHNQDKLICITDQAELVIVRLKDLWTQIMAKPGLDIKKQYGLKGNIVFVSTINHDYKHLCFLSSHNSLKKIDKGLLLKFRKFPTVIMNLEPGEKIISIIGTNNTDKIAVISQQGMMLIFPISQMRAMGKTSGGIKGIGLQWNDQVADMFLYREEPFLMVYSNNAGKLLSIEDLKIQKRSGKWIWVAELKPWELIKWWYSIIEGGIRVKMQTGKIMNIHSNDMTLDDPMSALHNMTSGIIEKVYIPREEREQVYKNQKKEEEKRKEEEKLLQ